MLIPVKYIIVNWGNTYLYKHCLNYIPSRYIGIYKINEAVQLYVVFVPIIYPAIVEVDVCRISLPGYILKTIRYMDFTDRYNVGSF